VRLFGRNGDDSGSSRAGDAVRDPQLPVLSVDQARQLHGLVSTAFAERGREVVVRDGYVEDDAGSRYGLANLAAVVAAEPSRRWSRLVARHIEALLAAVEGPDPLDGAGIDAVRDKLFRRLQDTSPGLPLPEYATLMGEGLCALLTIDLPTSVRSLSDDEVERLGGADLLAEVGAGNLRALPLDRVERHEAGEGVVHLLLGQSYFTASRALVLDHLLATVAGAERPAEGVLLAAPHRHALALHVVEGPGLMRALAMLGRYAAEGYAGSPGAVSPRVWYVQHGRWHAVADSSEGVLRVDLDGPFGEAARRLVGEDGLPPQHG
jgi:hypothetical protein